MDASVDELDLPPAVAEVLSDYGVDSVQEAVDGLEGGDYEDELEPHQLRQLRAALLAYGAKLEPEAASSDDSSDEDDDDDDSSDDDDSGDDSGSGDSDGDDDEGEGDE